MTNTLIANVVHVIVPADRGDCSAKHIPMNDQEGRKNAVNLRKAFNASVLDSLKVFAADNALQTEVDFSQATVSTFGFSLLCSDKFEQSVRQANVPHIGHFLKDRPLAP